MTTNPETDARSEFTTTRVFDAPRDLLWAVWTEPAHMEQWWGPNGVTTHVRESDLRPGGKLVRQMRTADGRTVTGEGVYAEVVAPERLVTTGVLEMNGAPAFEIRTTVTFEAQGGKTSVTMHQVHVRLTDAAPKADGAQAGACQMFDRLEAYLETAKRNGSP